MSEKDKLFKALRYIMYLFTALFVFYLLLVVIAACSAALHAIH